MQRMDEILDLVTTKNVSIPHNSTTATVKDTDVIQDTVKDHSESVLFVTNSGAEITFGYFAVCILTIILAGWIIYLNGLVIQTLICHKIHSDVTDYFVSSLSISDLVTGVLLLYVSSYSLFQYQNFWECLFRFGLTYGVSQSSFNHILAITFDRFVKIICPLRYFTLITKKTVIIISSMIWAVSLIIGLLPLLGWHKEFKPSNNGDTVCRFFGVLPDGYFIFNFVTSLITSLGMLSMYACIIYIAIKQQQQMKNLMEGYERTTFDDQKWKLVKTVAIIVLFSNLCWLPGVVVIVLHIVGKLDHMSYETRGDLIAFCGLAVFLNSLINPLIYAAKIDKVKKRFIAIFCCKHPVRGRLLSQPEARQSSELNNLANPAESAC